MWRHADELGGGDKGEVSYNPRVNDAKSPQSKAQHSLEVEAGARFRFGENWARFIDSIDDNRIRMAERSLVQMLGAPSLEGKTFLDVGSGSGLFSLAARRLGARVRSFDFDPQSVACTMELRRRYFPDDGEWVVEQGSVLDQRFVGGLGRYEIVYSWGVLHHTGSMWEALRNVAGLVGPGGSLYIAIYNDQGGASRRWLKVKRLYNRLPGSLRWLVVIPAMVRLWGPTVVRDAVRLAPLRSWRTYSELSMRGMSPWRDVIDWVGGLPFEVAKPEEIFDFYRDLGFRLARLRTWAGGHGCNEYVFTASDR